LVAPEGFEERVNDVTNAPVRSVVIDCDGSPPSRFPSLFISNQTTPLADEANPEPPTVVVVPIGPDDGNMKSAETAYADGDNIG
jgi:hypothetical protein